MAELQGLGAELSEAERAGVEIVAISPDPNERSQKVAEGLRQAGLPLGSGVVMAINRERDLRQTLLSLAHFFAHESCGKCFPCQLGTQRQLEIVEKVARGSASKADIAALEDVGFAMTAASFCGLGVTAGTAILSALEKWPALFIDGRRGSG